MDGRKDGQAQSNMPLQLFQSWGIKTTEIKMRLNESKLPCPTVILENRVQRRNLGHFTPNSALFKGFVAISLCDRV